MKAGKIFLMIAIIAALLMLTAAARPADLSKSMPDVLGRVYAADQQAPPLTAELLVAFVAGFLSLLFSYFPGLNTWYAGLSSLYKYLIMIALTALTAAGAYGIACLGFAEWLHYSLSCDNQGLIYLIGLFIEAIMANQSIYKISPPTKKVALIKAAAKAAAAKKK